MDDFTSLSLIKSNFLPKYVILKGHAILGIQLRDLQLITYNASLDNSIVLLLHCLRCQRSN